MVYRTISRRGNVLVPGCLLRNRVLRPRGGIRVGICAVGLLGVIARLSVVPIAPGSSVVGAVARILLLEGRVRGVADLIGSYPVVNIRRMAVR